MPGGICEGQAVGSDYKNQIESIYEFFLDKSFRDKMIRVGNKYNVSHDLRAVAKRPTAYSSKLWGMQGAPHKDGYESTEPIHKLDFYALYTCCKQQDTIIK